MTDAGFEKVTPTDKPLYGPRKLLLCGFAAEVQPRFAELLEMLGLGGLPRVWAAEDQAGQTVGELLALPDGAGFGKGSNLPRAIVMAGITQKQMHRLMNGCRQARMQPPLWAALTPVSETWPLGRLLSELAAEHAAMARRRKKR